MSSALQTFVLRGAFISSRKCLEHTRLSAAQLAPMVRCKIEVIGTCCNSKLSRYVIVERFDTAKLLITSIQIETKFKSE